MLIFLLITFSLFLLILLFFTSPSLSPIPYYPTNKRDLPFILKNIPLNDQTIFIDLGSGTGEIIFPLAHKAYQKKLETKLITVEINPILLIILFLKRFFHPNKKNIVIQKQDMFSLKLILPKKSRLIFYAYSSPKFLPKLIKSLKKNFAHFEFISYLYPLKNKKPKKIIKGKNNPSYFYSI